MNQLFLSIIFSFASILGLKLPLSQPNNVRPTPTPQISIFPSITLAPTPQPLNSDADIQLIKTAFAAKYGRSVEDVVLTTKSYDGNHFVGSVSFKLAMEGGILLATKDDSQNWIIVMDGNGQIPCEAIQPYHFPATMVDECYNREGKVVELK